MTPPTPPPSRISSKQWLRWLMIPPLVGAITVVLLSLSVKKEMVIDIAVEAQNLAADMTLMEMSRQSVKVVVSGTASALKAIGPENAACRVDLTTVGPGVHTVVIHPHNVVLPRRVTLIALLSKSVTVQLEALSRKTVNIVAQLEGKPAPGFAVGAVSLKPDRITLNGRAFQLEGIDTVKTRPIDLAGADESFKKEVPLDLAEAIETQPPRGLVLAQVDITERIVTRVIERIPIAITGMPASNLVQIRPDTITLTVSGPQNIVKRIEHHRGFAVSIDLRGLNPGSHTLMAAIELPVRTRLVKASPEKFSVIILE
jgi:YbbR domain-containing protein